MDFCQCVIPVHILNDDTRACWTENQSHLNERRRDIDTYVDVFFFCTLKNKSRVNELREKSERHNPNCNYKARVSFV